MADTIIRVGSETIRVLLRGAAGPRGLSGPDLTELAGTGGAAEIGVADGGTLQDYLDRRAVNTVHVLDYGADASGVGASGPAFAAAAAAVGAGGCIVVAAGVYNVNQQIDILDHQTWIFQGATIQHANDAITIFRADSIEGWSFLGKLALVGTLTAHGTGATNEKGIHITDAERCKLENIEFRNFKGAGLYINNTGSEQHRGNEGQFLNMSAQDCEVGIYVDVGPGAEYNSWSNTNATGCRTGLILHAGNNRFNGGNLVDNETNCELRGGANNHGHGSIIGFGINHAGIPVASIAPLYNLLANDVGNGFTFLGCHFYEHPIFLRNSRGINIIGGIVDCPVYNDIIGGAYAGINVISDNFVPTGGTGLSRNSNDGGEGNLLMLRNRTEDGLHNTCDPAEAYLLAGVAGAGQSAASGAVIEFDSIARVNGMGYNTGTGEMIALVAGYYRVAPAVTLSGTGLGGGYLAVEVDSGSGFVAVCPLPYGGAVTGGGTVCGGGMADVFLDVGDKVRITSTANGTSPVVVTGSSRLTIELLG